MATFGQRLREYREKHGLQVQELADKLNTSRQVIWSWENDNRTPRITTVVEAAKKLGVPLEYLLGEEEPFDDEFNPDTLTEHEIDLIIAYRIATPEIRTAVERVLGL